MADAKDGVAAFFGRLTDSWSANDGTAFADFYTEDGSLINPFGERADGRAGLSAMYTEYFGGMLKGTTTAIALTHLRTVDADHVFTDADQTIYSPDGDVVLALHLVNLLRKHGDEWRIVDSRPYAFSPAPA